MPIVGLVVGAIGSAMGTAAFAGTALASFGGAIGAGIATGLYATTQGGSFGKGFLMGAVGNYIGGQLGEAFGSAGGVTVDSMLADQMEGFTNVGDMTGELGWGADIGSTGSAGFGTSPISGEMYAPESDFISSGNTMNLSGEAPVDLDNVPSIGINSSVGVSDPYAVTDIEHQALDSWSPEGIQDKGVSTWSYDNAMENPLANSPQATPPTLATLESVPKAQPTLSEITEAPYNNRVGDYNNLPDGFVNESGSVAPTKASNLQNMFTTAKDKFGNFLNKGDQVLSEYGMPKGTTLRGLQGAASFLQGSYETYKAEQIAKGMKPMTLDEFKSKMYNANDYKMAANSMARSGRTGTLPVLLARMNSQAGSDYNKNYLPNAQKNYWDVKAKISQAKQNNWGQLAAPFAQGWALGQMGVK